MSVENQAEESSDLVSSQTPKATNAVPEESSHTSITSISTQSDDTVLKQQSEGPPEVTSQLSVDDAESAISPWLQKLSINERKEAFEFTDEAFLTAFLAMVVPPSSIRFDGTTNEVQNIEWNTVVSLKDFATYCLEPMARYGNDGNNCANDARSEVDVPFPDASSASKKSDDADFASKQPLDSEVFRIQCSDALRSLLKHVCVVFPSAANVQTEEKESGVPEVTVSPSYFESTSDEELFLVLGAMRSIFSEVSPFSCDASLVVRDAKVPICSSWLNHLSRLPSDVKAPLHVILLARLWLAVLDAFHASEVERTHPNDVPADLLVDTLSTESHDAGGSATDTKNVGSLLESTLIGTELKDSATLGSRVSDNAVSLRHVLSSMDASTLAECLDPFVQAFHPEAAFQSSPSVAAESLIYTPLRYLEGARQQSDFTALDLAVHETVTRILEHLPQRTDVMEPDNLPLDRLPDPPSDITSGLLPATSSHTSSQGNTSCKKKKKKSKRRKSRKLSNADQSIPIVPHAPSALPSSDANKQIPEPEVQAQCDSVDAPLDDDAQPKDAPPCSLESEDTDLSTVADDASLKSGVAPLDADPATPDSIAGGPVALDLSGRDSVPVTHKFMYDGEASESNHDGFSENGDLWETVEIRTRGTRKKSSGQGHHASRSFNHSNSSFSQGGSNGSFTEASGGSKRNKGIRSPSMRKKTVTRKVAKDLVLSVLDAVDEEVKHRHLQLQAKLQKKQQAQQAEGRPSFPSNPWRNGPPLVKSGERFQVPPPPGAASTGTQIEGAPVKAHHAQHKHNISMTKTKVPSPRGAKNALFGADQNTAPTIQETVSAYSNVATVAKSEPTSLEERVSRSDLSSDDTDEAPQNRSCILHTQIKGQQSHVPPLPKMLSAENANSANSSVASSLEVPHSSCRHHHSSSVDVNDVGYHLLDVCDRLSSDMSLFMSRRSLALNARRRERGALLAALQSTVASLWPSRGHAEMYGSCATQLDLPSSDLDVVIIGLDQFMTSNSGTAQIDSTFNSTVPFHVDGVMAPCPSNAVDKTDDAMILSRQASPGSFASLSQCKNADRVVRLASELESQPWAVQVKSIPTASVPVVKVLADPSKLSCSNSGGEWMLRHQHLASQAAAAAGSNVAVNNLESHESVQQFPLWRGADVINGLLKLDITFEGPEHGGIGSTQFSSRVVSEACQAAGVHPEATALVQVVMVLKEILAQRKLNEPYSGGLSSYALLLLVVSLLQERAVIREEIERAERQRQAVAAGECTSSYSYQVPTPCARGNAVSASSSGTKSWADHAKSTIKTAAASVQESLKLPPKIVVNPSSRPHSAVSAKESSKLVQSDPVSSMKSSESSWASIARKSSNVSDSMSVKSNQAPPGSRPIASTRPAFVDGVSRTVTTKAPSSPFRDQPLPERISVAQKPEIDKLDSTSAANVSAPVPKVKDPAQCSSSRTTAEASIAAPSFYPQGYNDIIEVLCSGETTAGKLLMHFLLYYGQNFDAQSTAIDVSGKHERDFGNQSSLYSYYSPYIPRRTAGIIDPVTGMLTVDPIVIYDPLEGAENNNVARRCFAWSSVRWVFAQSYATLCSAVERSATPPATPGGVAITTSSDAAPLQTCGTSFGPEDMGNVMDPSSPLLRCLLSF